MADTYIVQKGDTLSEIAVANGTTTSALAELNNIVNQNLIYIGQTLKLSGTADPVPTNTTSKPTITAFGLQSNTDRTVFAIWTWDKSNTENYQTKWYYDTGMGVWFEGTDTIVTAKQSVYTAPENATRVKFQVLPISKTREVNGKTTSYWTAGWSTAKTYDFSNNPPKQPNAPTVKIEKYKLTATLDNLDINATLVQFQVVKNNSTVVSTGTAPITTTSASFSYTVDAGGEYKVRCRGMRDGVYGDWSAYSDNVGTIPSAPSKITACRASSKTSVHLEWTASKTATSYDIEYTTKKEYFNGSDQTTVVSNIETTQYEKTGLESGQEYFFRVRAVNDEGHSTWSGIKSVVIGKAPAAPTTWSSTTKVVTGEPLKLYWIHNAEDESSQTYAKLELIIDGVTETLTITNSTDEDEKDKTSVYSVNTSTYLEGTQIQWRVKTAGITKEYGDWSVQRTVDVYAPATLEFSVTDSTDTLLETLESFPIKIRAVAGPNTQTPIGYHLSVIANASYETVDDLGRVKMVNKGESVYARYFDISEQLDTELTASDLDLENNIEYTITCVVSMDSGLTAESSLDFTVAWTDVQYEPNCEIGIDAETYTAFVRPHCTNEEGVLIEGVLLSVYRREFDGKFTELAKDLDNTGEIFITDPHPALDYARYRVVARTVDTGAISYYDVPGYPVGGKAVIIQWDEEWSTFDTPSEDAMAEPAWAGSLLKLPYNIDVSDSYKADVSLVEYIGRSHPVSYYGTQLGETSTWSVDIAKTDEETIYSLRRLAKWMGNAYVREPSGSGYWAQVSVSFNQKHCETVIPVTLGITRVEGGVLKW